VNEFSGAVDLKLLENWKELSLMRKVSDSKKYGITKTLKIQNDAYVSALWTCYMESQKNDTIEYTQVAGVIEVIIKQLTEFEAAQKKEF